MNKEEQKQGKDFQKGNFSCSLENVCEKKEEFVKLHKGKVSVDINGLWDDIETARNAYFKTSAGKAYLESKKAKA